MECVRIKVFKSCVLVIIFEMDVLEEEVVERFVLGIWKEMTGEEEDDEWRKKEMTSGEGGR